jgi:Zn-dependent peptidase ImmA (M78 family)
MNSHPNVPLTEWMSGEKEPTIKQLEAFAKSVNVPFGYLFLEKTPKEEVPFPMFRGEAGRSDHFDLNVYDTVNSGDAPTAQLFTLVHETVHLMLGISAGHAEADTLCHDANEKYCDMVAAEFLVPAAELRSVWNGDIKDTARKFRVSELVVARRAHDMGLLTNDEYNAFWMEYRKRPLKKKERESGGGNFYRTSVKRVGRLFAIHVKNAVADRQLSYLDAYRLTGLYGNTYTHFMNNEI